MSAQHVFVISLLAFAAGAIAGGLTGNRAGYETARTVYQNYGLAHDDSLRNMGVCEWSEAVAKRIECGGQP